MTFEEFWAVYDEALARAENGLVQFAVTSEGVIAHCWGLTEWSPIRSSAVSDTDRARYHVLAMHHCHV